MVVAVLLVGAVTVWSDQILVQPDTAAPQDVHVIVVLQQVVPVPHELLVLK